MSESGKRNSSSSESKTMMICESSWVFIGGLRDEEAMGPGKSSSEEESITIMQGWKIGGEEGGFARARCWGGAQINWTRS